MSSQKELKTTFKKFFKTSQKLNDEQQSQLLEMMQAALSKVVETFGTQHVLNDMKLSCCLL
jgi:hypothetical protein